uniref:NBS-LRR-like resistance protein n=1 Tax=Oryza sativa TaxID=4530 RepID=A0A0U2QMK8_ORYSA|nr:NBS-LRR-like resistance protein [Oryza sativa]
MPLARLATGWAFELGQLPCCGEPQPTATVLCVAYLLHGCSQFGSNHPTGISTWHSSLIPLLKALDESYNLGGNASAIKAELLYTHKAQGRNVAHSPALAELLRQLSHLAEDADNVLDKVDYYRIRDHVKRTHEAADDDQVVDGRLVRRSILHARHAVGKCRRSLASSLSCRGRAAVDVEFFNRSIVSERIKSLMAQMQPLCAKISDFLKLELMDPRATAANTTAAAAFSERVTTTTSTSLEAKLYGGYAEFYAAINEITGDRDGLAVLPVVGPGGIGKTTFTQHLFHDQRVKKHFHVRIWVHVSLRFDVLRLTKEIFNNMVASEVSWRRRWGNEREPHNLEQLQTLVERRLQSRRFLLILDDMWPCDSEYKWDKFLAPFRKTSAKGSTVIVTTRSEETADMVKSETNLLIRLGGLDSRPIWAFFLACALGDERAEHHKELLDLGREIVKKLKFSPLAAKTVGRLLKKDLTRRHWSRVLDSKEWEHADSVNDIMPALKLSYDCPPFHLQKCSTYCALFPDDYQYQDSELTHLWSALGVINCSARIVSSRECLSIDCSNPRSVTRKWDKFRLMMGETQTPATNDHLTSLPSSLPEYYHLRFLDLQDWTGMTTVPKHMQISHLIYLRQFLASKELQSSVAKIGKLKLLQELSKFQVNREERAGFELQQLGELRDLGGALTISNLHKVKTRTEAEKAKLTLKRNLVRLKLVWDETGREQTEEEANSIEGLQPPANLRELCIKNHKGNSCPSWFDSTISLKRIEVLHLHGVSWNTLPPFGQIPYLQKLKLENIAIEKFEVRYESLENLKSIEFNGMLSMVEWILRVIGWRTSQASPVEHKCMTLKTNLRELVVRDCPQLSLPLMPHTTKLELAKVASRPYKLLYDIHMLEIRGVDNILLTLGNLDNVLAFHDMEWLVRVTIKVCSSVPLATLQKLTSLETLAIEDCISLSSGRGESDAIQIPIKHLMLRNCYITGKELSEILACCPCLSHLEMEDCKGITGLCMQQSSHEMDDDDDDIDGMLQFPSQFTSSLSRLGIFSRDHLTMNVKDEVLKKLMSLHWLQLGGCVLSCAAMQAVHDDLPLMNNLKALRAYGYDIYDLEEDRLMPRMARTVVAGSKELEELDIGSISGVLAAPICQRLSASLHRLTFRNDTMVQHFTEEQETALKLLTSLQELIFYGCNRLQSLPSSLCSLRSLKRLEVSYRQLQGYSPELEEQCNNLRQHIPEVVLTCIPLF